MNEGIIKSYHFVNVKWVDMGSIFHIENQWNILVIGIGNYYVNFQNYQSLMLLYSSDTKRTLMHLFLFTNSAQRELVSICLQSICNCNYLSLHYNLAHIDNFYLALLICLQTSPKYLVPRNATFKFFFQNIFLNLQR